MIFVYFFFPVAYFFGRIRLRKKLRRFDVFIDQKKKNILPYDKIPDKFRSGSSQPFPPLFPPTAIRPRMFTINEPICWQYLAHVVLTDSSCTWRVQCCKAENFSKQAQPREGEVKFFAPFRSKLFPRKINKQYIKHNKSRIQEGRLHLRLVFPLTLQEYATRQPYELS